MMQRPENIIGVGLLAVACLAGYLVPMTAAQGAIGNAGPPQQVDASDLQVRTIDGLRKRRLFDLAIGHSNRTLQSDQTSAARQVDIVVALIESMGQKAYQSANPQDWQTARETAAEWQRQSRSPRKILIDVQSALLDQLQIERWVREIETQTAGPGTREQGLAAATSLIVKFQTLRKDALTLLNRRPSPREQAAWFSPDELLTLRYNLSYQEAKTLGFRAALYGENDLRNRNDVLAQVQQQLESVLGSVGSELPLWWTVQADLIAVARQLEDYPVASRIFAATASQPTSPDNLNQVKAEWIRTLVKVGRLEDAILIAGKDSFATETPTLDLARVQLYVSMSSASSNAVWQQRALDLTSDIEKQHGGYWGRLANLAVVGTASSTVVTPGDGNLDLLIRVADESQRKKQWPEAIRALDTAYQRATESGQTEIAWKLGFRAASIEQEQNRFAEASQRFQSLSQELAQHPQAHAALLMACWNMTRLMKTDKTQVETYQLALTQLLDRWPASPSANQARLWMASLRIAEKNWPSALGLLLDVQADSPLFGQAVERMRQVVPVFLAEPDLSAETRSNIMSAIMVRLVPLLDFPPDDMPDNWPTTHAEIVLQLAELKLVYHAKPPANANFDIASQLQQLVERSTLNDQLKGIAQALQFLEDPNQTFPLSADNGLQQRQLDLLFRGLAPAATKVNPNGNPEGLKRAWAVFSAEIEKQPESAQKRWAFATIEATAATGDSSAALAMARNLATRFPKDARAQIYLAELLTDFGKNNSELSASALKQWRMISAGSRKNTETWFVAKYHVCKLLADQGKQDEALKLLNYLQAVPPGWGKANNASDFDQLHRLLSK